MARKRSATDTAAVQPILRTQEIRAVEALHAASLPLMERAGAAAFEAAIRMIGPSRARVIVLCGPGNNGGDGFVLARLLAALGHEMHVGFAGDAARLPADARAAFEAWRQSGGTVSSALPSGDRPALAVDALFGIGLARPIGAPYAEWVAWLNGARCPVLSIDIPSGLDADSGQRLGECVRAARTITFIALKPGLLTLDGPDQCGEIELDALGIDLPEAAPRASTIAPALFRAQLVARARNSHKGMMGDASIIGGAEGMIGAALLAARAALALGAGRVFVGLLAAGAPRVDLVRPELMLRAPLQAIDAAGSLAVGPGLGQGDEALRLLEAAAAREVPLVLDADALNLVAAHPVLARRLARRAAPNLLAPHPAEAARLLGTTTDTVQRDRVGAAIELARRLASHVALKGCGTVLAEPSGRWRINTSGNPGMASAGMGDALTGIAVALLAQGWPPAAALAAAVHVHGAAADRLVARGEGPVGLAASELIAPARALLNEWIAAPG